MSFKGRSLRALVLLLAVWSTAPAFAGSEGPGSDLSPHAQLQRYIATINTETDQSRKGDLSLALLRFVQSGRIDKYSDFEIDEIADLLNDDNGAVISWTALSLARIGPDARRAAPTLQKIRLREECRLKKHPVPRRTQTDIFPLETAMFQLSVSTLPIVCAND